jgi:uncharacterized membrane protein (UPF0127 family)
MIADFKNKKFIILLLAGFLISLGGIGLSFIAPEETHLKTQNIEFAKDALVIKTQAGMTHVFQIELAISPQQAALGLMNRDELLADHGMLFVFDKPDIQTMWMKNTHIPLDMLFIDQTGRIKHIAAMARPYDEKVISSQVPVSFVLEINGGQAEKLGINVGDMLQYRLFSKF